MDEDRGESVAQNDLSAVETARRFFDLTGDMLAVLDHEGRIITANATLAATTRIDQASLAGTLLTDVIVPPDGQIFDSPNSRLSGANIRVDFEFPARVDGRDLVLAASLHLESTTGNRFFVAHDISEQHRLRLQLGNRGNKDELGGLSNRHGFNDAVDLELKVGSDVAVIHISIDGVDDVSSEHGDQVADQLLQAAVSRMRRNLRDSDTMARFSRGEFAVMLVGGNARESAERLGAQLADSLRRAFGVKGSRIELISAVGVAAGSSATHTAEQLMVEAGKAVREARQAGHTCAVVFGQSGLSAIANGGPTNDDVRDALANADQFGVHVQGIFSADGRGAMGVETMLVRHRSAMDRLADHSDDEVLEAITADAAAEVFASIGSWLSAQTSRRVCINIAAPQVAASDLFASIASSAKAHSIAPRQVVCELSEATLADGAAPPRRMAQEVGRHGFQLCIDDFGRETASLANLLDLDAAYIKLDPALVANLFTSDFHSALIRSAVDVARTMGVSVIANGVANQQQLEAVRRLGCSFVQGPGVHVTQDLQAFADRLP